MSILDFVEAPNNNGVCIVQVLIYIRLLTILSTSVRVIATLYHYVGTYVKYNSALVQLRTIQNFGGTNF